MTKRRTVLSNSEPHLVISCESVACVFTITSAADNTSMENIQTIVEQEDHQHHSYPNKINEQTIFKFNTPHQEDNLCSVT